MKFKNIGQDVKVRLEKEKDGYKWITVKAEEIVDLPEKVGLDNGFEKIESEEVEEKPKEEEPKVEEPKVEAIEESKKSKKSKNK